MSDTRKTLAEFDPDILVDIKQGRVGAFNRPSRYEYLMAIIVLIEAAKELPVCDCPGCKDFNELFAKLEACNPIQEAGSVH